MPRNSTVPSLANFLGILRTRGLSRVLAICAALSLAVAASVPYRVQSATMLSAAGHVSGRLINLGKILYIYRGISVEPPKQPRVSGTKNMPVFSLYVLQTAKKQRASIRFRDGTVLHMNERTRALFGSPHQTYVKSGEIDEVLAPGTNHTVRTAVAVAAAIGTNFDVRVVKGGAYFTVLRGALSVKNKFGPAVVVKKNQFSLVVQNHAPNPAQQVNATRATNWTNSLPPVSLGENIALDGAGGHVIDASSHYSAANQPNYWDPKFIIDGTLDFGWESASGSVTNQWVKIGFAGNRSHRIASVIIDPAATHGDFPDADLKDFEIRVSTTGTQDADFSTVFKGTCEQANKPQIFHLPRIIDAKYVELYALNNYGSPDWLAVAEFEVISAPT